MSAFSVSYARYNDSEATAGGTNRHGMVDSELSLSEAVATVRNCRVAASEARGVCASDSIASHARWVTLHSEEWETGDSLELSIHFPETATPATRARLVRLLSKEL